MPQNRSYEQNLGTLRNWDFPVPRTPLLLMRWFSQNDEQNFFFRLTHDCTVVDWCRNLRWRTQLQVVERMYTQGIFRKILRNWQKAEKVELEALLWMIAVSIFICICGSGFICWSGIWKTATAIGFTATVFGTTQPPPREGAWRLLCSKAPRQPSLGEVSVIPITVPYWQKHKYQNNRVR